MDIQGRWRRRRVARALDADQHVDDCVDEIVGRIGVDAALTALAASPHPRAGAALYSLVCGMLVTAAR